MLCTSAVSSGVEIYTREVMTGPYETRMSEIVKEHGLKQVLLLVVVDEDYPKWKATTHVV